VPDEIHSLLPGKNLGQAKSCGFHCEFLAIIMCDGLVPTSAYPIFDHLNYIFSRLTPSLLVKSSKINSFCITGWWF
jgi:hypothetical protein